MYDGASFVCHGSSMPNQLEAQDVVDRARSSQKNEVEQGVSAPFGWCCDLCSNAKTDEPHVDSLTPATRRFVDHRLEAAIDELRRLDPRHRYAVRLAIDGLTEIRDELGL